MFKKRALQVRLVPDTTTPPDCTRIDLDLDHIHEIAKDVVTHTAVTVGAVYTGYRIVNTLCKITEIAIKAKLR